MNRVLVRAAVPTVFIALLSACGSTSDTSPAEAGSAVEADVVDDGSTMFTAVRDHCDLPADAVRDSGATLVLDGEGEREDGLTIPEISCALGTINTPESIVVQIEQTRALDGRQTVTNDGYSYTWVYHPDTGLDVTITDAWTD